jgi:hypothetical protein
MEVGVLRTLFFIFAGLWIVGGTLFHGYAAEAVKNVCGSLTIMLGLAMLARWTWQTVRGGHARKKDGDDGSPAQ